jgi:hypothetical protein
LAALGFEEVEDLGRRQIVARYFPERVGAEYRDKGGHIARAATIGP